MAAEGPPLSGLVDGIGINSLIRLILAKNPKKSCCPNPSFLTSMLLSCFKFHLSFSCSDSKQLLEAGTSKLQRALCCLPGIGCPLQAAWICLCHPLCPDVQPREGSLHSCILAAEGCIACFRHERDGNRTLESSHVAGQSQWCPQGDSLL